MHGSVTVGLSDSPMPNSSLTPGRFAGEYSKLTEKVSDSLRRYLGEPNEQNTKDVRTSARRINNCISIMPEKSRSKALKRQRSRSRKVLALTSRIRDADIIRARLSIRTGEAAVDLLLQNIAEEREVFAFDSMRAAWKLFETKVPELSKKDVSQVSRWVRKTIADLDKDITKLLPVVVRNEGKVEELHTLRKQAKKLRYTLELVQETRASTKVVGTLVGWQDLLGAIRDSDVVIEYLGRARPSRYVREVLVAERRLRHRHYLEFIKKAGVDVWERNDLALKETYVEKKG
jgi:CHAD domain-containing protein